MVIFITDANHVNVDIYCIQSIKIKHWLSDYGVNIGIVPIKCDNTSAINLTKNIIFHSQIKPNEDIHHFMRGHVEKRDWVI